MRELRGAIQIVKLLSENKGEVIERRNRIGINGEKLFVVFARLIVVFHCVINKAGE